MFRFRYTRVAQCLRLHSSGSHRSCRLPAAALDAARNPGPALCESCWIRGADLAEVASALRTEPSSPALETCHPLLDPEELASDFFGEEDINMALKNVIFDLDGTLVDSAGHRVWVDRASKR